MSASKNFCCPSNSAINSSSLAWDKSTFASCFALSIPCATWGGREHVKPRQFQTDPLPVREEIEKTAHAFAEGDARKAGMID
jgi:hypothetical protein